MASPFGIFVAEGELERSDRVAADVTALREGRVVNAPEVSLAALKVAGWLNARSVILKPGIAGLDLSSVSLARCAGGSQVPTET